tara:strand:+ start:155 stop:430 length:276 start_codon:yes stop_codon:yes gene_type:complete
MKKIILIVFFAPYFLFCQQTINASLEIWRFFSKYDINGLVSSTTEVNEDGELNRKLLQVVDLFGRQSTYFNNQLLFYIYDDGNVEKKIIIK